MPAAPRRTARFRPSARVRRGLGLAALLCSPLVLSGCTLPSFGAHPSATKTGHETYQLWQGFTIGAIVVGGITLVLIIYAAVRYRVRPSDEGVPRQSQYHLPLEVVYTAIPILIVLVLFAFTVVVENDVTALPPPGATISVYAEQWGWQFNYPGFFVAGQTTQSPTMEMPEGENVQIILQSKDVIHGFYVRDFNFSRQALPGVVNRFTFYAQKTGTFFGQCTQYCGLYHSIMWFQVKVVTQAQYAAWLTQNQTAAASRANVASKLSTAGQLNPNIPIRPYLGGGTN